jgi:hypothetical protein
MRLARLTDLWTDGLVLLAALVAVVVSVWAIGLALLQAYLLLALLVPAMRFMAPVPAQAMLFFYWVAVLGFGPFVAGAARRFFFPGARARPLPWWRVVLVCAHEPAARAARDQLAAHGLHARLAGWQPHAGAAGRIAVTVPRREYALARELVHPRVAGQGA